MGELEIAWIGTLALIGLVCARKSSYSDDPLNGYGMSAACIALAVMVLFGWPVVAAVHDFLYQTLPQRGTGVHQVTVWLLVGLAMVSYIGTMTVAPALVLQPQRKKNIEAA